MKISICFLLCLLLSNFIYSQSSLKFKYDKVILYDFESKGEKGNLIFDTITNKPLQIIRKEQNLSVTDINSLHAKLFQKKSYGSVTASCFDPHFGWVYYLNNKIVGQVSVCFGCNKLSATFVIAAQQQGKQGEGEDVYYIGDGMSKAFRKQLNSLIKKYKFSHQLDFTSDFDK